MKNIRASTLILFIIISNQFNAQYNIINTYPAPVPSGEVGDLAYDGSFLWLGSLTGNGKIYKISPITGLTVDTITTPLLRMDGLTYGANHLWAAESIGTDGRIIYKINPSTKLIVDSIIHTGGDYTHGMQYLNGNLYVNMFYLVGTDTTYVIDTSGTVLNKFSNGFNFSHGITYNGCQWLISTNEPGLLNTEYIYYMNLPTWTGINPFPTPNNIQYPNGIVWADNYLWVSDNATDSLYQLEFSSINIPINIVESTCNNYTSPSGNYTWYNSGTYMDTIINPIGCDSVITINLTINSSYSTINQTSCNNYTSPSGNYSWYNSGTYVDTIPNSIGCDSIITINLTIDSSYSTINQTSCNNYTSPSGNYSWYNSGTYMDTIPNSIGCDSIVTINLIILNQSTSIINVSTEDDYLSPSGQLYTTSGTYIDTLIGANKVGCDSLITINLLFNNNDSLILIPNIFTPNQDGFNDLFNPIISKSILSIRTVIYNRWGELLYQSNSVNEGWNGRTTSGIKAPEGTYFYIFYVDILLNQSKVKKTFKGTVSLLR